MGNHTIDLFAGLQAFLWGTVVISGFVTFGFAISAIDTQHDTMVQRLTYSAASVGLSLVALMFAMSIK